MMIRKNISIAGAFFLGMSAGAIVLFTAGVIVNWLGYSAELTTRHKSFGDIEIWAQRPVIPDGEEIPADFYQKADRMLWMTKNGAPFLMIFKDIEGRISGMHLLKNKDEPVLSLEPLTSPGKWGYAYYSNCKKGKPVGDVFLDIDFNGSFDFKIVADSNGRQTSRFILVNDEWRMVDRLSPNPHEMRAIIDGAEYLFEPNSGCWQKNISVNK